LQKTKKSVADPGFGKGVLGRPWQVWRASLQWESGLDLIGRSRNWARTPARSTGTAFSGIKGAWASVNFHTKEGPNV